MPAELERSPPGNSRDPQAALFEADEAPGIPPAANEAGAGPAEIGYRGPTACAAAGITYRQLDYWARTGLVEPSVRTARGSGSQRLYSFRDIMVLKVIKRLPLASSALYQDRPRALCTFNKAGRDRQAAGRHEAHLCGVFMILWGFS